LLLFLEYDLIIVYKPNKTHVITDALSKLPDITKLIGVHDQTTCVNLFYIELEWPNDVKTFLKTCQIESTLFIQ